MIFSVWEDLESEATMLVLGEGPYRRDDGSVLDPLSVRLFTIEANSWEEAQVEYHRRMGWEPYRPNKWPEKS